MNEWKKVDGGKQPYHLSMTDGGPFAFAGLWSS
jgi:putative SOS response-associated peptidase YedK